MITPLTVIEAIKTDFLKSLSERLCTLLAARGAPLEQAYSALEKDDPPNWEVQATLGVSKDFVIPHMIDFWFLLKDPAGLEGYLKAIRAPGAKKQASTLKKIFSQSGKISG